MDKLFFISLVFVGGVGAYLSIWSPKRKLITIPLLIAIIGCLFFQGWYGIKEKEKSDARDQSDDFYKSQSSRREQEALRALDEMKEKEKKGLLTDADYGRYIALYLENINLTLKNINSKNTRERVEFYYEAVDKIPVYFSPDEWRESETFIYNSMIEEINGHFASRNIRGGIRDKVLKTFKEERERLLKAKEREFTK